MKTMLATTALALCLAAPVTVAAQTAPNNAAAADQATNQGQGAPTAISDSDAGAVPQTDGDIIVTAQRRSESAQRVPISLTALDATALEQTNVTSIRDLQRVVPSFSIQRAQQAANTRLAIRGIGSFGNTAIEPSVGAFVDGIYIARPGSLLAGLNDIASVEVLRGPQGTLFGRNASMGAISFRTALPSSQPLIQTTAEYGSYDRRRIGTVVNSPLGEYAAFRVAGLYDEFDGFGRNEVTGRRFGSSRLASVRGTLRTELSPSLTWIGRADYQALRTGGLSPISVVADTVTPAARANFVARLNGLNPKLDDTYSFLVRQNTDGTGNDQQWGVSSEFQLDLGGYALRLLSSFRDWHNRQFEADATSTLADIFSRNATFSSQTHSEELQLTSPEGVLNGRLNFVAGLYYFQEDYFIGESVGFGAGYCPFIVARSAPARLAACNAGPRAVASTLDFDQGTESLAGYGQATFKLTDTINLTGGIRYSHDSKDADISSVILNSANLLRAPDDVRDLKFDGGKVTYRANATYTPVRDVLIFATYATGFKSGGFDSGNGVTLGRNRTFRPELTTNWEVGAKTQFLDRRLTLNATLFRTDIDDFQLRSYNGIAFSVRNAGSIRQQGVEFEVIARPFRGLTLGVSGTRLDSEFTDFRNAPGLPALGGVQDLTGRRAPTSPKWQGVTSASYIGNLSSKLRWSLSSNLAFQSASDVGAAGDANPQGNQPGYALLGGRVSIRDAGDSWEAFVVGDNLTDKGYCTQIFTQPFNGPLGLNDAATGGAVQRCVIGDPATVRVGVKIRFR